MNNHTNTNCIKRKDHLSFKKRICGAGYNQKNLACGAIFISLFNVKILPPVQSSTPPLAKGFVVEKAQFN